MNFIDGAAGIEQGEEPPDFGWGSRLHLCEHGSIFSTADRARRVLSHIQHHDEFPRVIDFGGVQHVTTAFLTEYLSGLSHYYALDGRELPELANPSESIRGVIERVSARHGFQFPVTGADSPERTS